MAQAEAEVYAHKLFAPTTYSGTIRRDAILDRILGAKHAPVVLLQGPAGHGKSTALQQLKAACEARGCLSAWLSLDEADNDVRRFSMHLQALLAGLGEGFAGAASWESAIGDPGRRRRSDWLIDLLLKLPRPVALFFDDFQALGNKTILTFFRGLLERVPEHVRIFLGSRSVPEIGLARLVIGNRAQILRAGDLRFSAQEVERFFAASAGLTLSRAEIEAIYRRTEGWPAAVQLFRLALDSPSVRSSLGDLASYRPRELAEYLADNVLGLQPPRVQEFLLRTSLLRRLTAPLCDAVTGWQDSQEMLLQLERSGLFVQAADSGLRWFTYHGLFASLLSEQLRSAAAETWLEVHRGAARWHLEQGLHEEAMHHFVAAGQTAEAVETMDRWAAELVSGGQLMTLERWFDQLPFEQAVQRPQLVAKVAYAFVFLRRQQKLARLLGPMREGAGPAREDSENFDFVRSMAAIATDDLPEAFRIAGRFRLAGREPAGFSAFELSAAANVAAYKGVVTGDFESAANDLALAHRYNPRGEAVFSRGYTIGVEGVKLFLQGRTAEALECFRRGIGEQRMNLDGSFASSALVSCYIWALYEVNRMDQAEALFAQHHDIICDAALLDFMAVAYIPMARIHDARGRPGKAQETLDELEHLARENAWARLVRIVQWERVRRHLLAENLERASQAARRIAGPREPLPPDWMPFSEDLEGEATGRVRLAIHRLALDEAASALAQQLGLQRNRVLRQVKLHLLEAQMHARRGAANAAHRSLRRALQEAGEGRFVRCFLDEGEGVISLLREEYQAIMNSAAGRDGQFGPDRAYIELLLQASGTDLSRAPPPVAAPTEPLTEREKEILVFLANGVSNKEMASRIFVSENTVKFHLKNIYSKLSVCSRLQAITAARGLGLIH
ncbi:MAG: LuxR family transcriptional regulator [Nevskia sp.]|nr:LuxR family transcriptional regulator [Nevskia sp.]